MSGFYGEDYPEPNDPDAAPGDPHYRPADPYEGLPHPADIPGAEPPGEKPAATFDELVAKRLLDLRVADAAKRRLRTEGTAPPPLPTTLTEFLLQPDPEQTYRVDGLLPSGGKVVIAAQRKAGKTTTMGNLTRCLVDGGHFLGEFRTSSVRGTVVDLDFELPEHTMRRWLRDHRIINTDRVIPWSLVGKAASFNLLERSMLQWWAEAIKGLDCSVLIVDCLRPILDAIGLDENHEAGRFLVALDQLQEMSGVEELILVHHAGHSGERSRGDSRLRDWPDAEWRLMREGADRPGEEPPPDAKRFFSAEGRDVAVPEGALDYDRATRTLTFVKGSRAEAKSEKALNHKVGKVIAALREMGAPMSAEELYKAVGGKKEDAVRAAKAGVARRLVMEARDPEDRRRTIYSLPVVEGADPDA